MQIKHFISSIGIHFALVLFMSPFIKSIPPKTFVNTKVDFVEFKEVSPNDTVVLLKMEVTEDDIATA